MEQSRIKHLELIQGVIGRLAGHSFAIKGLAVTVTTGVIGAAAALKRADVVWAALIPLLTCWGLDAFYLRREKMFRALYDVERQNDREADFNMRADLYKRGADGFVATAVSASILGLYFPLVILVALLWWRL